eukprot:Protomagalhaensia_wolfi_Nauph_80__1941@NODE_221_length_3145_cov_1455_019961_g166_i0_p2_GENE_NODE_221_length_3145_cov_1455_019961_g166_i0NODE_221_length_3145_cov_1455_019961_g166_i0_p2_ORF_typecomplete_len439_score74_15Exo5/PF09810_9/1_4e51PDDEXK_1/PF12705_7/8_8e05Cas_Cas4/PF01930_17/3_5Cas_Cas4/PF01930_17/17_NODE_221_length_3145_cov_1455_019961_g166_i018203136
MKSSTVTYKVIFPPSCHMPCEKSPRCDESSKTAISDIPAPTSQEDQSSPNPLERFRQWKLSVTDFSSQLWCETQLEFTLKTGFRQETEAMREGIRRHEKLEQEDHEVVEVEVQTREDSLGLRLVNAIICFDDLLAQNRKVREVWILATPPQADCVLRGIVDEFAIERTGPDERDLLVIRDTKTRRDETEPSLSQKRTSALQLQIYRLMMDWLRNDQIDWSIVWKAFKVDPSAPFEKEILKCYAPDLNSLCVVFTESLKRLPTLADYMVVEYDCNGKLFKSDRIPYSEPTTSYALMDLLDWWEGRRSSCRLMAQERWKCRNCPFLSCCTVSPLDQQERDSIVTERLGGGLSDLESPLTTISKCTETRLIDDDVECSPPKQTTQEAGIDALASGLEVTPARPHFNIEEPRIKRCLPLFSPTGISPQKKLPQKTNPLNNQM